VGNKREDLVIQNHVGEWRVSCLRISSKTCLHI